MTDDNKRYISGTYQGLLRKLEEAFAAGFTAGYHSEDNPACYEEDWEEFLEAFEKENYYD